MRRSAFAVKGYFHEARRAPTDSLILKRAYRGFLGLSNIDSARAYAILKLFGNKEARTLTQWDMGFFKSDPDTQCRPCRPHFTCLNCL